MTEASVVAVGTPQSFRQQLARALEVEAEEVGWVQSATAAEELLIHAYHPVDVLVLSPEVKEPDALGLAEFVGRQAPGTAIVLVRDHTWNGLLPAAMRAGIRDVVDMTQGTEELREAVERAIVWAANLRSVGVGCPRQTGPQRKGRIISVFSSKGGTRQDVPDHATSRRRSPRSRVRTRPSSTSTSTWATSSPTSDASRPPSIQDLMELGEGADRDRMRAVGVQLGDHLWALRRAAGPRGRGAGGRGDRQVPAGDPQRLRATWSSTRRSTTRTRRSCASTCRT